MNDTMRILIACDGAHPVRRMVDDLRRAALPRRVEVVVLTVAEGVELDAVRRRPSVRGLRGSALDRARRNLRRARGIAARAAARIRAAFPGWKVVSEGRVGSPAQTIIQAAERHAADLIVMGSHNRPGIIKFFFGSVAQSVAAAAPCSVRIVRPGPRTRAASAPLRIVIGVDGSADCARAVDAVAGRQWPKDSAAHLVAAIDSPMSGAVFVPAWSIDKWVAAEDVREDAWIHRMTALYGGKLRTAGLRTSVLVKIGDPKSMILEEAARWNAGCIFVGARGLNKLNRLFMGSVSSAVASRAVCAVEVVRRRPSR